MTNINYLSLDIFQRLQRWRLQKMSTTHRYRNRAPGGKLVTDGNAFRILRFSIISNRMRSMVD
jgi:hypothetical protein